MHMAVFLPVSQHQLFPSGGLNHLQNYKGPALAVALFFVRKVKLRRARAGGGLASAVIISFAVGAEALDAPACFFQHLL